MGVMRVDVMNKIVLAACGLALLTVATGCEKARSSLGMNKQTPDEFAVVTRAPLNMPPDYGLRPPAPGTERPQEKSTRNAAREILLGGAAIADRAALPQSTGFSSGESAILKRAGALNADPSIRDKVNTESRAIVAAEDSFLNKIIFWQEPDPPGVVVDAGKELTRLREASALGTAPNKTEVPIIKRKERGILEGIF